MRLTVAGTGYVGLVAGVCFAEVGHTVICTDIDEKKLMQLQSGVSPLYEEGLDALLLKNNASGRLQFTADSAAAYANADAIFIGVGTPEQPDGSADLAGISSVGRQIAESVMHDCLVVVKSTVPVGTGDKLERFIRDYLTHDVTVEVASNPEFLAQGTAIRDMLHASRIVVGTQSRHAEKILREIYAPFDRPIVSVTRRSAELIKYACNNFLALKISYINDIANLCECVGADIEEVALGMSYDDRIGSRFLKAGIGYGGSCFPKDLKALNYLSRRHGCQLKTVEAAGEVNDAQKIKLFDKARDRLMTFRGIKAAVLGLTFKPGTDDLRGAPSVDNVRLLLDAGANVCAYDPAGLENFKKQYQEEENANGTITFCKQAETALDGADVCFILTEWQQIQDIRPATYKRLMRTPLVFDGRNIYGTEEMQASGVEYHSIGR